MSNGSRTRKRRYCYFATLLVTFKLSASGFNNESGIGNLGSGIIEQWNMISSRIKEFFVTNLFLFYVFPSVKQATFVLSFPSLFFFFFFIIILEEHRLQTILKNYKDMFTCVFRI